MTSLELAADVVVVIHFAYISFTVGGAVAIVVGALFGWRWTRSRPFRLTHLLAVLLVAVQALIGVMCPLTVWEYRLRQAAGQHVESDVSFVARIIREIVFYDFPAWVFLTLYIGFGLAVFLLYVFVPPIKPTVDSARKRDRITERHYRESRRRYP